MSHTFARFNIPRNLALPEKSRPNGHKGAVNTGKPHVNYPIVICQVAQMGLGSAKSGNTSSNARIIHFRESIDLPLPGVPYVHLLQKRSTMCINQILQQNFSIIISGESPVNFSLAIIRNNSYLKENMIF